MTTVVPMGKISPESWVEDTKSTVPELSDTVGASHVTYAPGDPTTTVRCSLPGQVTAGGMLSTSKRGRNHKEKILLNTQLSTRKYSVYIIIKQRRNYRKINQSHLVLKDTLQLAFNTEYIVWLLSHLLPMHVMERLYFYHYDIQDQ